MVKMLAITLLFVATVTCPTHLHDNQVSASQAEKKTTPITTPVAQNSQAYPADSQTQRHAAWKRENRPSHAEREAPPMLMLEC